MERYPEYGQSGDGHGEQPPLFSLRPRSKLIPAEALVIRIMLYRRQCWQKPNDERAESDAQWQTMDGWVFAGTCRGQ